MSVPGKNTRFTCPKDGPKARRLDGLVLRSEYDAENRGGCIVMIQGLGTRKRLKVS